MTDRDTTLQEAIGFAMETLRDDLVLHMMDYLKGEGFTETDSLRPKCRDSTRSEWEMGKGYRRKRTGTTILDLP